MYLLLSGEGPTDIGSRSADIGPMSKCIDQWIEPRIGYSMLDYRQYEICPKQQLVDVARFRGRKFYQWRGDAAKTQIRSLDFMRPAR